MQVKETYVGLGQSGLDVGHAWMGDQDTKDTEIFEK